MKEAIFYDVFDNMDKFHKREPTLIATQGSMAIKSTNLGSDANMYIDLVLAPDKQDKPPPSVGQNGSAKPEKTMRRIQFDVFQRKASVQSKHRREFVDVLHKGIEYRLSICLERQEPFDLKDLCALNLLRVRSCRIKNRRSWKFEFMRVDLTTVFTLSGEEPGFPLLMDSLRKYCQLGQDAPGRRTLVEAEMAPEGFLLGLARDFKSEFISRLFEFAHSNKLRESRQIETEIFEPEFLERHLPGRPQTFQHLIGRTDQKSFCGRPRRCWPSRVTTRTTSKIG